MAGIEATSSDNRVNGYSGGEYKPQGFNMQEEFKKKDIFSFAAQHPNLNLQGANAGIW